MANKKVRADREICDRLNLLVGKSDLTITEIAARTGINRRKLHALLAGEAIFHVGECAKLCRLFKVSPAWLLGMNELLLKESEEEK